MLPGLLVAAACAVALAQDPNQCQGRVQPLDPDQAALAGDQACLDFLASSGLEDTFARTASTSAPACPFVGSADWTTREIVRANAYRGLDRFSPDQAWSQVMQDFCAPRDGAHFSSKPMCVPQVVGVLGDGICSGTLVAPGIVLTARHCLPAAEVLIGWAYEQGEDYELDRPFPRVEVLAEAVHPDRRADVALLALAEDLPVPPLLWRTPDQELGPAPTQELLAVGFGSIELGEPPPGHQSFAKLRSAPDWGCSWQDSRHSGCIRGLELVATRCNPQAIQDTCRGDSGGALVEPAGDRWRLVGVTSRAVADSSVDCGDGGLYTRVDAIAAWMIETIPRLSRRVR